MRVRMTTHIAGAGFAYGPGEECEFPEADAVRLIASGASVPVAEADIEIAVRSDAPEKRQIRKKRKAV